MRMAVNEAREQGRVAQVNDLSVVAGVWFDRRGGSGFLNALAIDQDGSAFDVVALANVEQLGRLQQGNVWLDDLLSPRLGACPHQHGDRTHERAGGDGPRQVIASRDSVAPLVVSSYAKRDLAIDG